MRIPNSDFSIFNTPMPGWTRYPTIDAGWLYIIENDGLLKIGKTTNPKRRLREARTWPPYGEIIGIKPFWCIHEFERTLLCGIANFWCGGEWHDFPDDSWSDSLITGFQQFTDHDRNRNTVDFGYWIGGSGMGEVIMEQNRRRISLHKWQREAGTG
jgi:hypothetical protein